MTTSSLPLLTLIAHHPDEEAFASWLALVDAKKLDWSHQELLCVLKIWHEKDTSQLKYLSEESFQVRLLQSFFDRTDFHQTDIASVWGLAVQLRQDTLAKQLMATSAWPTVEVWSQWRLPVLKREQGRFPQKYSPSHLAHDLLANGRERWLNNLIAKGLPLPADALNWATPTSFEPLRALGLAFNQATLDFWSRRHQDGRLTSESWKILQNEGTKIGSLDLNDQVLVLTRGLGKLLEKSLPTSEELRSHLDQLKGLGLTSSQIRLPVRLPDGKMGELPLVGALGLAVLRHHASGMGHPRLTSVFLAEMKAPLDTLNPEEPFGETTLAAILRLACVALKAKQSVDSLWTRIGPWSSLNDEAIFDQLFSGFHALLKDRSSDRTQAVRVQMDNVLYQVVGFSKGMHHYESSAIHLSLGRDFLNTQLQKFSPRLPLIWSCLNQSLFHVRDPNDQAWDWVASTSAINSGPLLILAADALNSTIVKGACAKVIERLEVVSLKHEVNFGQWSPDHPLHQPWSNLVMRNEPLANRLIHRWQTEQRLDRLETAPTSSSVRRPRARS